MKKKHVEISKNGLQISLIIIIASILFAILLSQIPSQEGKVAGFISMDSAIGTLRNFITSANNFLHNLQVILIPTKITCPVDEKAFRKGNFVQVKDPAGNTLPPVFLVSELQPIGKIAKNVARPISGKLQLMPVLDAEFKSCGYNPNNIIFVDACQLKNFNVGDNVHFCVCQGANKNFWMPDNAPSAPKICDSRCGVQQICDRIVVGEEIPFCSKGGNSAKQDICDSSCLPADKPVCRKSGILDCTGSYWCDLVPPNSKAANGAMCDNNCGATCTPEICDFIDNNCDGSIDEGSCVAENMYITKDVDGDGEYDFYFAYSNDLGNENYNIIGVEENNNPGYYTYMAAIDYDYQGGDCKELWNNNKKVYHSQAPWSGSLSPQICLVTHAPSANVQNPIGNPKFFLIRGNVTYADPTNGARTLSLIINKQ